MGERNIFTIKMSWVLFNKKTISKLLIFLRSISIYTSIAIELMRILYYRIFLNVLDNRVEYSTVKSYIFIQ